MVIVFKISCKTYSHRC